MVVLLVIPNHINHYKSEFPATEEILEKKGIERPTRPSMQQPAPIHGLAERASMSMTKMAR